MMPEVIVAIGANAGNPVAQVELAMDRLQALAEGALLRSSLWRSEPVGMNDQSGAFVNAVVAFETTLAAGSLLAELQALEIEMGRPFDHGKNVARAIDLDLITYGEEQIARPELEVPHPRTVERLFVLLPLAEICPGFILPGQQIRIDVLIQNAPAMEISRL
tara:strand:+ start:20905 stop:21390 length:486 start_codon:yes stop_codon:yes gene_type:complete